MVRLSPLLKAMLPALVNVPKPLMVSAAFCNEPKMLPWLSRLSDGENEPVMLLFTPLKKAPRPACLIVRLGPNVTAVVLPGLAIERLALPIRTVALSRVRDPVSVRLLLLPVRLMVPGPVPPVPVTVNALSTVRRADGSLRSTAP